MADHSGHRKRLKAEFLASRGVGWADHKLLELLLCYALPQGDVNPLAHDLIERFGSLSGVLDASEDELCKIKGVSQHTAILLRLMPVISGRYLQSRSEVRPIVNNTRDAYLQLHKYFIGARNEMSYVLCLDGKRGVLGVRKLAEGSIDAAEITVRRIAEEALAMRAARIYLAHNHISNIAAPSPADMQTTMVVRTALAGIGVELVDHLVFSDDDMVSIRESEKKQTVEFL